MADVGKVQGPSGPPENQSRKEKIAADADKFKQAMRKRVTEVSQVDPDEQKKRKRQEEAEEEQPIEGVQGPTTPADQVTPFSLGEDQKKASPLDLQKGGAGISPMESAQPITTPPPPKTAFFQAPSQDEMQDDSGVLEEEAFIENIPSPQAAPQAGLPPPSIPTQEAITFTPTTGEEETQQQQPVGPPPQKKARKQAPTEEKKTGAAAALESTQVTPPRDTRTFFEQMDKEEKEKKGPRAPQPEEEVEEAEVQGVAAAPPPFVQGVEGKEESKTAEKKEPIFFETPGGPTFAAPEITALPSPPPPEMLAPYARLHPDVMELFDRMVGVMTVMTMSGMTETSFTLNAPQFASSVFFGTQIIIQEFSTAPKAFNIQLNATPQAVALFQGNIDDLMAAFQAGQYNFRVNRLETGYLTERPLFKRKEKAGGKEKDQTGENP